MKKINFSLAFAISLAFMACNNSSDRTDGVASTNSAKNASTASSNSATSNNSNSFQGFGNMNGWSGSINGNNNNSNSSSAQSSNVSQNNSGTNTSASSSFSSSYEIVTNSKTDSLHYNVDVSCSTGKTVIAGGCDQGGVSESTALTDSHPIDSTGWHCRTRDIGTTTTRTTTAYAICTSSIPHMMTSSTSNSGTGDFNVNAYCAVGQVIVGGGCDQGDVSNDTAITDNHPIGNSVWHCRTRDFGNTNRTVTAYAICAPQPSDYEIVTSSGSGTGHFNVDVSCSSGKTLIGGGCDQNDISNSTALTESRPSGTTGWHCRTRDVFNWTQRTVNAYAICAASM